MKNWFTGCTTLQALKERYKTLAKAYHPDLNPEAGDEAMQQINAQYDELVAKLSRVSSDGRTEATEQEAGEKEHTCTVCGYTEKAEIEKLAAKPGTDTPATGDNSHMALWIALLFVSGAGVIGTTVYSRKKRAK